MSSARPNLAEDPFLNRTPVERFRLALWLLGAVLLALNVSSYLQQRADSTELRARSRLLEEEIDRRSDTVVALQETLLALGPQEQNSTVRFLNRRIAERTFPWGELFDNLGEILPSRVRLRSLTPRVGGRATRRGARAVDDPRGVVELAITGIAGSDDALYRLLDAFFEHPRFEDPKLGHQRSDDGGAQVFSLDVTYLARMDDDADASSSTAVSTMEPGS